MSFQSKANSYYKNPENEIKTSSEYLKDITTEIDFSSEEYKFLEIKKSFSNKFMSVIVIQLGESIRHLYDNHCCLVRCFHEK